MRIVVTSSASTLGQEVVAQAQAAGHDVLATDRRPICGDGLEFYTCDLAHPPEDGATLPTGATSTDALLQSADFVIHIEPTEIRPTEWLDDAGRCTYNLLAAAAVSGTVRRVVLASSLSVMEAYGEEIAVEASYRPRPTTEPCSLGPHCAEFVAREFAHCTDLGISIVRLGTMSSEVGGDGARWWQSTEEAAAALLAELDYPDADRDLSVFADTPHRQRLLENSRACRLHVSHGHTQERPLNASAVPTPNPRVPSSRLESAKIPHRVLLLGASGMLGPSVVRAMEEAGAFALKVTDIGGSPALRDPDQVSRSKTTHPLPTPEGNTTHEYLELDVSDGEAVREAARGTDCIVNCSVLRHHPRNSFQVNVLGAYNAVSAAIAEGHQRLVHTGPIHAFRQQGSSYEFEISEAVPLRVGLGLYGFTKGLGLEILRVFAENHPIHILSCLFAGFPKAEPEQIGQGFGADPCAVTFADGGRAVCACLHVPLARLPSRAEDFWMLADLPHGVFKTGKAQRLLGWEPRDTLEGYTHRVGSKL